MKSIRTVDESGNIWYKNEKGLVHNEDGPAVEWVDGGKEWFINGLRHREDGPALIWTSGSVFYFLNNNRYSKEDWEREVVKIKLERILDL